MRPTLAVLMLTLAFAAPAGASDAKNARFVPTIEQTPLGGALTLLALRDDPVSHVNAILSSGEDGLLLVDFAGDWQRMKCDPAAAKVFDEAIRGHADGRVRYLINTHWHGDHVAGNEIYGREAAIVAHRNTRRALSERQTPWWHPEGMGPLEPHARPSIVFDNTMSLHMNGEEVQLWHFGAAHTDGDAVVYFTGAKVAHVGDLYHGYDKPSMPEDAEGMLLTLQGIASRLPLDAKVVTGHGGVTDVAEFTRYQQMYAATLAHVRREVAAGKTLEAIQAAGLPAPWKNEWNGVQALVPMWIDAMHRSVSKRVAG